MHKATHAQGTLSVIIFRYFVREVLTTMFAVSFVLLLITMSARMAGYLGEAASGRLDAGVLFTLMAYRLPGFLELIFPLGLFIGILLAYGRMYTDSEMTVLAACGMSERKVVVYTLYSSFCVAVLVAVLTMFIGPQGVRASEALLAEQRGRTDFETLKPERFHTMDDDNGVTYAESISADKQRLHNVFMASQDRGDEAELTVMTAETGETVINESNGRKYLLLKNGRRYIGRPGEVNYRIVDFDVYSQLLPEPDYNVEIRSETDGMSTAELLNLDTMQASAALQWRFSLPILVLIVGLLAVPLSRTQPRRGRYTKILPAIIIYMIYLVSANAARGTIEEGNEPVPGLLWWIHAAFLFFALLLLGGRNIFKLPRKHKAAA